MRFVRNWFLQEGPGIPKNAPKKTGLTLFLQILTREAWELVKLNWLIIAFSLPLVTAPAAFAAGTCISNGMVADRNIYLLREFWEAFRALFVSATLLGLIGAAVIGLGGYASFIYGQLVLTSFVYAVPLTLAVCGTVFAAMGLAHAFVLLAASDLRGPNLIKAALLAALARPLPVLAALGFILALWVAHILLYPASIFMPAVFNFSLGCFALSFACSGDKPFVLALRGRGGNDNNNGSGRNADYLLGEGK
jgi:uncharacterized membrane protein YesL